MLDCRNGFTQCFSQPRGPLPTPTPWYPWPYPALCCPIPQPTLQPWDPLPLSHHRPSPTSSTPSWLHISIQVAPLPPHPAWVCVALPTCKASRVANQWWGTEEIHRWVRGRRLQRLLKANKPWAELHSHSESRWCCSTVSVFQLSALFKWWIFSQAPGCLVCLRMALFIYRPYGRAFLAFFSWTA